MSRRARKRRAAAAAGVSRAPRSSASRSEQRNAEARARLHPLAEGERPLAVSIGALLALTLGLANVIAYAAGVKVGGHRPAATGIVSFSVLMLIMAVGMWRRRYWAVLGMQALLGIVILIFAVLLVVASNLQAAIESIAVVGAAGTLFWFLIKAMARIQMPRRPG